MERLYRLTLMIKWKRITEDLILNTTVICMPKIVNQVKQNDILLVNLISLLKIVLIWRLQVWEILKITKEHCILQNLSYNGAEFEYNVLSAGEKEVVDILLDLYLRKEEYDNTIFIIDEPELHINTSIQRKLLIEINRLIGDNCQLWLATHSIGFLRALQEELKDLSQIIEFKTDVPWASTEQTLCPIIKSRSHWGEYLQLPSMI